MGEVREHSADAVTDVCTEHGEGVIWDAAAALVRFVDLEAGALMTYDPTGGAVAHRPLGKVAACVRPRRGGGLVVALERSFVLLDPAGEVEGESGPAFTDQGIRFNDGGCDPAGRFWVGTMAYDETPGAGTLHRFDPDGSTHLVLKDVTISNGLSFAPDGRSAYYVDTPTSRIDVLEVDPVAGTITGRHPFAHVDGHPDGIAVDAEGGVWAALWQGSGGQPLRRAGPPHRRRPAAALAGDLPRVRRGGPRRPVRDDVAQGLAGGPGAARGGALPAPPRRDRRAGPAVRGVT